MNIKISEIETTLSLRIDNGNLEELADNIKEFGLLHPIVVRQTPENKYHLLAGSRRLLACQHLGWSEIPATLVSIDDELRKLDTTLHENLRRKDLNYVELAEAIFERRKLWEQVNGKIDVGRPTVEESEKKIVGTAHNFLEETSRICRMEPSVIYRLLKLNNLDDDLKDQVRDRSLPYRKALTLQAERKKSNPQYLSSKKNKNSAALSTFALPNPEQVREFTHKFNNARNLVQLIFLLQHISADIRRVKNNPIEWHYLDLEYAHLILTISLETKNFMENVIQNAQQIQSRLLEDNSPPPQT